MRDNESRAAFVMVLCEIVGDVRGFVSVCGVRSAQVAVMVCFGSDGAAMHVVLWRDNGKYMRSVRVRA